MDTFIETATMTVQDIRDLLELKGWTQVELARRLQLHEAAVSRWLSGVCAPTGPAKILMRQWLNEARRRATQSV